MIYLLEKDRVGRTGVAPDLDYSTRYKKSYGFKRFVGLDLPNIS